MRLKVEIEVEIVITEGDAKVKYDGIRDAVVDSITDKFGIKRNLMYIDDYEVTSLEII